MKRFGNGAAATFGRARRALVFAISNLHFSALWIGASLAATFLLCAVAIHAIGYRVVSLPPVTDSATLARQFVRRHPERFAQELERALRRHRSPAASVQR